ncbi:MAG: DGQHR domain-containing protein [Fibrobacter sp.]|nr:DGQHR domain-containing protein [Fibrobacter sp.]
MIKCPYMKISQREEVFFLTKFRSVDLKKMVNFHFRQAYANNALKDELFDDYIEKVRSRGINLYASPEGVQRRLQLDKLKKIKEYLENTQDSFFPNTVILSVDLSDDSEFMDKYLDIEKNDIGFFEFPDDIKFQIVDGQHRLAGLFWSNEHIQEEFEIPVVLLINITLNTCAKIFADVNGNQSPVNKSVIYDLYELMGDTQENREFKILHDLCKSLNEDPSSPLYQHVKMLGIGGGAVSQSFLVNAFQQAFLKMQYHYEDSQKMYESIYLYLKCYQRIFQNQWAVLENATSVSEFRAHSAKIMKIDKSQALKTNGLGAIMRAFPMVYKAVKQQDYQSYFEIVSRLKDKVNWCSVDLRKGTGDKTQKAISDILLVGMGLKKMKKIIVIRSQAALVETDYDSDRKVFVSVVKVCSDELNSFYPRIGETADEAIESMRRALMNANNAETSIVMDALDGKYNDDEELFQKSLDSCNLLVTLKDDLKYPENAFGAIKKYVEEDGIVINKFKRVYSAKNLPFVREALKKDCAMEENGNFWLSLQKPQI